MRLTRRYSLRPTQAGPGELCFEIEGPPPQDCITFIRRDGSSEETARIESVVAAVNRAGELEALLGEVEKELKKVQEQLSSDYKKSYALERALSLLEKKEPIK